MNIIIIGGFLGSGKTTTLMLFAQYLIDISDPAKEYKVVILENEVGEISIDDAFLRSSGFKVNSLFAGCACCTVAGELVTAVAGIRSELDPEWLVIETTGIAYPGLMRDNLKGALNIDSRICVLTDAARWSRLRVPMENLLRGQIECADIVLVNKIDLASEEALQSMEQDIAAFNPDIPVVRMSATGGVGPEVWESVLRRDGQG